MNGSDTTDAGRSHDNNNMANIVHPEYIHITHIHNIYNNFFLQLLSNYLKSVFTQESMRFPVTESFIQLI